MAGLPCLSLSLSLSLFFFLCSFSRHGASMESPSPSSSSSNDKQILLQIKASLQAFNSKNSSLLSEWNLSNESDPCEWPQIACSNNHLPSGPYVTGIDLSNLSLQGSLTNLTSTFSSLLALSSLNLSHNNLSGFIPQDIASCIPLTSLDLSHNKFTSFELSINATHPQPQGLSSLSNLQFLHLQVNNVSSLVSLAIPHDCKQLQTLNLSSNSFTNLSSQPWHECTSLARIDLSYNRLSDKRIPTNLTLLPSLSYLSLGSNSLGGPMPASCVPSSSSALTHLDLSDNLLNGSMTPGFIATCSSLQHLDISGNNIVGSIAAELGNMSGLEVLNLSENLLEGPIPTEIGDLAKLQVLMLGSNKLSGNIPGELSKCKSLTLLDLNTNQLGGNLPPSLQQIPSLAYIVLHSNHLYGSIPPSFHSMQALIFLDLSNNSLSGTLPPSIANMSSLQFLLLADNSFHGEMPLELGQMSGLQALDLSSNSFHGYIPSSLGNLQRLLWLMLAHNNLSNSIPAHLGNCTSLLWLNLKDNSLSGEVPLEIAYMGRNPNETFDYNVNNIHLPLALGECLMLMRWIPEDYPPYSFYYDDLIDKRSCNLFWLSLFRGTPLSSGCGSTYMGYIQLTNNKLVGEIPVLYHTSMLLLSFNSFVGSDNIGMMSLDPTLIYFNVSHNNLSGPIPGALSNSKCLELLDLSYNSLSGSIPQVLGSLSQLSKFNVSYNPMLRGAIPSSGQFPTFSKLSYAGDPLLCYENVPGTMISMDNSSLPVTFCGQPSSPAMLLPSPSPHPNGGGADTELRVGIAILSTWALVCMVGVVGLYMWMRPNHHEADPHPHPHPSITGGEQQNRSKCRRIYRGGDKAKATEKEKVRVFQGQDALLDTPSLCRTISQLGYQDIVDATNGFSTQNVVGSGGFGTVYRAALSDGSVVAVKRLSHHGPQGERQFLAEMETLGNVSHPNLVPLLGCFTFGHDKLLFYTFLPNGSLEDLLYKRRRRALNEEGSTSWPVRLKVACQCAGALSYLHHHCHPALVHRDMKSSNILLDENFNAYVADFGLARVLDQSVSHVSTMVAGTLGYVPPEYYHTCRATPKGDVYSFGVIMLELITGRKPLLSDDDDHHQIVTKHESGGGDDEIAHKPTYDDLNLVEWARRLSYESRTSQTYCPSLKGTGQYLHCLNAFFELSMSCTSTAPEKRPHMTEVSSTLESLLSICESP